MIFFLELRMIISLECSDYFPNLSFPFQENFIVYSNRLGSNLIDYVNYLNIWMNGLPIGFDVLINYSLWTIQHYHLKSISDPYERQVIAQSYDKNMVYPDVVVYLDDMLHPNLELEWILEQYPRPIYRIRQSDWVESELPDIWQSIIDRFSHN